MSFFNQFPDFVNLDVRKNREFSPVTAETLDNRHEVSLPKWVLQNKTVLDLGSSLGATGQWVLSHGAVHYTGVEAQPELANVSVKLLSQYWSSDKFCIVQQDLREFLNNKIVENIKYDVVVMVGVIYAFLDTVGILKQVRDVCNSVLVIDSVYPWEMTQPTAPIIEICSQQRISSSDADTVFVGVGSKISPMAMRKIMEVLGFECTDGILNPKPLTDKSIHDAYRHSFRCPTTKQCITPSRFLMRFFKTGQKNFREVADHVANNNLDAKIDINLPVFYNTKITNEVWSFNKNVAQNFQGEAITHIPDYQRVIELCLEYTKQVFGSNRNIKIVDVGSALGQTVDQYIINGYHNVHGIDSSQDMINFSKHKERIILSEHFVGSDYDVVLANWTLHFINDREHYIKNIFKSMNTGGMLIVSDKMDHSIETENLYHDFKRANGVTDNAIQQKKLSLDGVLTTKPLLWYLDILKNCGFSDIQIINTRYMFSTIYARKL